MRAPGRFFRMVVVGRARVPGSELITSYTNELVRYVSGALGFLVSLFGIFVGVVFTPLFPYGMIGRIGRLGDDGDTARVAYGLVGGVSG